jgi:hypothetical protein
MRVDSTRHHELAACIDDRRATRHVEVRADGGDLTTVANYVSSQRLFRINYRTAPYENAHDQLRISPRAAK